MYCPNCGKEIENNAQFCPYCGQKPNGGAKKKISFLLPIVMVVFVLVIIVVIVLVSVFSGDSKNESIAGFDEEYLESGDDNNVTSTVNLLTSVNYNDEVSYEFSYDADGNLVKEIMEESGIVYETEYDTDGRIASSVTEITHTFSDDESKTRIEYQYDYDDKGRFTSQIATVIVNNEATYMERYDYTYIGNVGTGTYEFQDLDGNSGGYIKEIATSTLVYSDNGQILNRVYSSNESDSLASENTLTVYEYDEKGNLLSSVLTSNSCNDEGITYSDTATIRMYTYDSDYNLISIYIEYDADDSIEYARQYEFSYEDECLNTIAIYSSNDDGTLTNNWFGSLKYNYLSNGLLDSIDLLGEDDNEDGEIDFEYDVAVKVTSKQAEELANEQDELIENILNMMEVIEK